jgi:threonine/homoserine/homoserine lactone efflux protein
MRRVALSSDETAVKDSASGAPISAGSLFRRWLLIHLSNPKSVLAWIALMTLGLGPGASWHIVTAILGGCAVLSVTIFCGYAFVFSTGGFEICIDDLSIWLMRITREIGRGTSVQALRERKACQEWADAGQAALPV